MWAALILPLFVLFSRIYILALIPVVGVLLGGIILSNCEKKDRQIDLGYDLGETLGKYTTSSSTTSGKQQGATQYGVLHRAQQPMRGTPEVRTRQSNVRGQQLRLTTGP